MWRSSGLLPTKICRGRDSIAGRASWFRAPSLRGLTRDYVLDNITLYWLTNAAIS